MPIQFEDAYVNPNIRIKGSEIPLEQLQQTSDTLQKRYDTSYENLTKFQELAKQAEQIADPLERQKVKDYVGAFQPQVDEMIKNNELHNVGWKTMSMANNAAFNLKQFQERATAIKDIKEKISLNQALGKDETKQYYIDMLNDMVNKTGYDAERNTFDFTPITAPKIVADADVNAAYQQYASGWLANKYGKESKNMKLVQAGQKLPNGDTAIQSGVYNTETGVMKEKVDFNEVHKGISDMMQQNIPIQSMIERDTDIFMKNHPGSDRNQVKEMIKKQTLDNAANAWSNKAAYTSEQYSSGASFDANATNSYMAGFGAQDLFNPNALAGISNKVAVDKSVEDINNQTKEINSSAFNPDGSFKGLSGNTFDRFAKAYEATSGNIPGAVGLTAKGYGKPENTFDAIVPPYYQKMYANSGMTQQQMFNKFQGEKANASKVLMSEYTIADKGRRETATANVKALLKDTPYYDAQGNRITDNSLIEDAWKSGSFTMVPYTGEITIGTGDKVYKTALGDVGGKENENNYAQIRMKAVKNVVQGLLDPTKATTYGDVEIPNLDPQTGATLGVTRFVVNKQGARMIPQKDASGNIKYVPSPGRISVINVDNNGNRQKTKDYVLGDGINPVEFTVDMLNDVVDPHILK
jgi:hypothetical protein